MPKKNVDYARTVIYKIVSKDLAVKELYVGSTTDLVKRRYFHKNASTNENIKCYTFPVYIFIRANGGFENWDVIQIEEFPCKTSAQQRTRERYWLETLGATLNSSRPIKTSADVVLDKHADYVTNRDTIIEKAKKYRLDHLDQVTEAHKKYYAEHRPDLLKKMKEYRLKNLDALRAADNKYKAVILKCDCGADLQRASMPYHKKSKKHLDALAKQAQNQ